MEQLDILIVEDEPATARTVELYLCQAGYRVGVAGSGPEGLRRARRAAPRLVILDLMLPGLGGLAVCQRLRAETDAGIIMLTARTTAEDRIRGLDLGADDYVAKPFSPRELVSRVRAVLRRTGQRLEQPPRHLRHRDLRLDPAAGVAEAGGRTVTLTPTESALLATLLAAPGRVFRRDELIERALGGESDVSARTVDAHVANLRRKLEPDRSRPRYILTVFGRGYRLAGGGGDG